MLAKRWQLLAMCVGSLVHCGSDLGGMMVYPPLTSHTWGFLMVQGTYGCFRNALYFFIPIIYFSLRSRQKIH